MTGPHRAPDAAGRLAVALDVPDPREAERLAAALAGHVGWCKVGLELYSAGGPQVVAAIARHAPVFLDLKLHDIPATVGRAAASVGDLGVGLLTVHATGGPAMLEAAVEGLGDAGTVLAVTVLTSMSDGDLAAVQQPAAAVQVPHLARLAVDAGVPGLVCAAPDLRAVRDAVGASPLLVTPGIRPTGTSADDQVRVATPAAAVADGADLLVVGRPITRAADPVAAADAIVAELTEV